MNRSGSARADAGTTCRPRPRTSYGVPAVASGFGPATAALRYDCRKGWKPVPNDDRGDQNYPWWPVGGFGLIALAILLFALPDRYEGTLLTPVSPGHGLRVLIRSPVFHSSPASPSSIPACGDNETVWLRTVAACPEPACWRRWSRALAWGCSSLQSGRPSFGGGNRRPARAVRRPRRNRHRRTTIAARNAPRPA
jgi:hypothetical protein